MSFRLLDKETVSLKIVFVHELGSNDLTCLCIFNFYTGACSQA